MIEHDGMFFDWDDTKEAINKKKHGVTFDEAITAFSDVHAQIYDDEEHSDEEQRFILVGESEKTRLLMVCHCYRDNDTVTRIFSARNATRHERLKYESGGLI